MAAKHPPSVSVTFLWWATMDTIFLPGLRVRTEECPQPVLHETPPHASTRTTIVANRYEIRLGVQGLVKRNRADESMFDATKRFLHPQILPQHATLPITTARFLPNSP